MNFLFRKLWRNRWLMLCLLMGNIILIGISSGTPMYITATTQRIFQQNMRYVQHARNTFPATMQLRYNFGAVEERYGLTTYYNTRNYWWPYVLDNMGVPSEMSLRTYIMGPWDSHPVVDRADPPRNHQVFFAGTEGFAENIRLTHGRMPSDELVDGNIIEGLAMLRALSSRDLLFDELMELPGILQDGEPMYFRIVGVFDFAEGSEAFWAQLPIDFRATMLMSNNLAYERFVRNYARDYRIWAFWTEVLDFGEMVVMDIPNYRQALNDAHEFYNATGIWLFTENFYGTIHGFEDAPERLSTTLWVLQIPIFVMLALYMYMVSRQILELDRNDISVLQSRGASRAQILWLYVLQGIVVAAVSFPAGIGVGVGLCRVLGASSGFLDMVQREALQVFITGEALTLGAVAMAAAFLPMFLPVIKFSKTGILEQKLTKRGKPRAPVWKRYFLDFLFLGISIYGIFTFGNQQELMSAAMVAEAQGIDPLLYLSSSLFIVGIGLVFLRLFPYLVKLVFWIGQRFWPPSLYASMLRVIRSTGEEQFIMVFLIFTLSLGIFSAQTARTINLNNEHLIRYQAGADLTCAELWRTNYVDGLPPPPMLVFYEPDFERWTGFEEVDEITRVMRRDVTLVHGVAGMGGGGRLPSAENVEMMGIETYGFGRTAWFRDDLLRLHINYFLNVLASHENGVLLSDNFRTELGYQIGDRVILAERIGIRPRSSEFTIVGFVDHWPAFIPVERTVLETHEVVETQNFLAVVNFGFIEFNWGMRPYHVWMRTNTDSSRFLLDFITEFNAGVSHPIERIRLTSFVDTHSAIVDVRTDPIVQGTNGIFTVGFIAVLLVCFTGFLIYWILSIRSRVLQFGIFRAMGMGMRGILGLLVNEQLFITLSALGIGALVGEISSRLFVPLLQISYTAAEQSIPLLVVIQASDYFNLYTVIAAMVFICMVILGSYISRINITQALKLGED